MNPYPTGIGVVLQDSASVEEHSDIVGPLVMIEAGAANGLVGSVEDVVEVVYQSNSCSPIPDSLGPFNVGLVASISSKAGGKLKESAVGDGVFVEVTGVIRVELPLETTIASTTFVIPAPDKKFPSILDSRKP